MNVTLVLNVFILTLRLPRNYQYKGIQNNKFVPKVNIKLYYSMVHEIKQAINYSEE